MVLKNAIQCLLKKWSKANLTHQGEEIDQKKVVSMIISYLEDYFALYSEQADKIVDIILKIVNISGEDEKQNRRKQDILRMTILHLTDFEIIDTVANLYVDLVCRNTSEGPRAIIETFVNDLDANQKGLEEKYTCLICASSNDLRNINESYYIIHQHFDSLKKSQEEENLENEFNAFIACLLSLQTLQKSLYICKDNQDRYSEEDNKYAKIKNLILCIKGQDMELDEDFETDTTDDIFEDIKSKINTLLNEVQTVVNDIKIKQKEEKLLGKRKQRKKLTEREQREVHTLDKLRKAQNLEQVSQIVQDEIKHYDENMRQESKKELFLKKFGPKLSRDINFYYLIENLYDKHDESLLADVKEFLSFFPDFYLPLYFTINKMLFKDFKLPQGYVDSLIKDYKTKEEQTALHNFWKDSIEDEILSSYKFLFFAELSRHIVETNVFYCPYILNKLGIPDFDEGMIYLAMFVKKIFMILKYIDVYENIQAFIESSFSMVSIAEIKSKISKSPQDLNSVVSQLINSLRDIFENSENTPIERIHKVEELQKLLNTYFDD